MCCANKGCRQKYHKQFTCGIVRHHNFSTRSNTVGADVYRMCSKNGNLASSLVKRTALKWLLFCYFHKRRRQQKAKKSGLEIEEWKHRETMGGDLGSLAETTELCLSRGKVTEWDMTLWSRNVQCHQLTLQRHTDWDIYPVQGCGGSRVYPENTREHLQAIHSPLGTHQSHQGQWWLNT